MFFLSVTMMSSMHAIQATHLHHHRNCLNEHDVEGSAARKSWLGAILYGPIFALRLHFVGYRIARKGSRPWIAAEVVALAALGGAAFHLSNLFVLKAHVISMIAGQCFTAFFAVWSVHHDCEPHGLIARTQRGWLKNLVSYDMFHHAEHHSFPAVPTCHLPALSDRLDVAAPEYRDLEVY